MRAAERDAQEALPLKGRRKPPRRAASHDSLSRLPPEEGGGDSAALEHCDSASKLEPPPGGLAGLGGWRGCLAAEPLLLWTLAGVVAGIALGLALKPAAPSPQTVALIGGWAAGAAQSPSGAAPP